MEHRKRSMMQHKVERSVLLQIATANTKKKAVQNLRHTDVNITKKLASEAIESLEKCDHCTNQYNIPLYE